MHKTSSPMRLRSTVVEGVRMLSWAAMERIYEHEVLPDAKLRKQAGERPLRAHAKRLTDGELLAKLRSFGIEIDRAWLERECARALSAQEIAGPLMDKSTSRSQESDWIWICVATLWRRWFPEQSSFEVLDDRMQNGYELLKSSGAVAACRIWLEAWNDALLLLVLLCHKVRRSAIRAAVELPHEKPRDPDAQRCDGRRVMAFRAQATHGAGSPRGSRWLVIADDRRTPRGKNGSVPKAHVNNKVKTFLIEVIADFGKFRCVCGNISGAYDNQVGVS